jgi:NADH-quinone oxidoreductase subunit G
MLGNLSTCKSPQQMFGSLAKTYLPAMLQVDPKDLVVVSIMPCTAKKFEAQRPEFKKDEIAEVDWVLTTQELARMIEEAGLRFKQLELASFDQPFGFKTGAAVIFGNSGGVSEAVLRCVTEAVTGEKSDAYEFLQVRGTEGIREVTLNLKGRDVRLAVVNGLKNAGKVMEMVKQGKAHYDLIEVMACPGGCIGGAGQPSAKIGARTLRRKGLYEDDKTLPLHKSQENPYITELYAQRLEGIGSEQAHTLLHTHYHSRRRMDQDEMPLVKADGSRKLKVSVCMGTSCYLRGSQTLLQQLISTVEDNGLGHRVQVEASFCFEQCNDGPTVVFDGQPLTHATLDLVKEKLRQYLQDPLEV